MESLLRITPNDEAHALAAEFAKTYSDMSYPALGLNCPISLHHNDPLRRMTRKFLKAKSPPANISMASQFAIKTGGAVLSPAFAPVGESHNGQQKHFAGVDCNRHYGDLFNTNADILGIVTSWLDTRDTILAGLGEVLELE